MYGDFRPTGFDQHIALDDREDWIVVPCMRIRDSGTLDESNFASALESLGGESDTIEVHRFGHWGPGWFEIILAHPSRKSEVDDIEAALESYPVLDEEDLSERECEAEDAAWSDYGARDIRRKLCETFSLSESTAEWLTDERLFALYRQHTSGTEHSDEGPSFPDHWITAARFAREDLARWIRSRRTEERQTCTAT
jgi:hypothetical protein